jgi:hypothetical protein
MLLGEQFAEDVEQLVEALDGAGRNEFNVGRCALAFCRKVERVRKFCGKAGFADTVDAVEQAGLLSSSTSRMKVK